MSLKIFIIISFLILLTGMSSNSLKRFSLFIIFFSFKRRSLQEVGVTFDDDQATKFLMQNISLVCSFTHLFQVFSETLTSQLVFKTPPTLKNKHRQAIIFASVQLDEG